MKRKQTEPLTLPIEGKTEILNAFERPLRNSVDGLTDRMILRMRGISELEGELRYYDGEAYAIFKKHRFPKYPITETAAEWNLFTDQYLLAMQRHVLKGEDVFIQEDAFEVLSAVRNVRRAVAAGDAQKAALEAIQITYHAIRAKIRPYEKEAIRGRKVREGGKKGRALLQPRYNDIHKEHESWRTMGAGMSGTKSKIAHQIERKTGKKFETIRKALRNKSVI